MPRKEHTEMMGSASETADPAPDDIRSRIPLNIERINIFKISPADSKLQ
jgi:hypothetical protein